MLSRGQCASAPRVLAGSPGAISSGGYSAVLIRLRSLVRVQDGPPSAIPRRALLDRRGSAGVVAQPVERRLCKAEVGGSSPPDSTNLLRHPSPPRTPRSLAKAKSADRWRHPRGASARYTMCGASAHRTGSPVRSTFTTEYGESCKSHIASANARIAESASQACPALRGTRDCRVVLDGGSSY